MTQTVRTVRTVRTVALALLVGLLAGAGFSAAQAIADQFTDVPAGNAFAADIDWLTDHDIASGYPDGTFHPTAPVNRQQASRWFRRYNAGIHLVTASSDPEAGTEFEVTADCPAGSRALMGSGSVGTDADLFVADSYANETFQWLVRWESEGDAVVDPGPLQVSVLCGPET